MAYMRCTYVTDPRPQDILAHAHVLAAGKDLEDSQGAGRLNACKQIEAADGRKEGITELWGSAVGLCHTGRTACVPCI